VVPMGFSITLTIVLSKYNKKFFSSLDKVIGVA